MTVLKRVLITVVVLAFLSAVGLAAWQRFAKTRPDIHPQVRSAAFQQRHTAIVTETQRELRTFVSTSHGTELAGSVLDRCVAAERTIGAKPVFRCQRNDIVYLAFDGDAATHETSWTRSLAAAGWNNRVPGATGSLEIFASDQDGALPVEISWRSGSTPPKPVIDFERGVPYRDAKGDVTLEQHPVDVAGVYQRAYAHHQSVAEISVLDAYYPAAR